MAYRNWQNNTRLIYWKPLTSSDRVLRGAMKMRGAVLWIRRLDLTQKWILPILNYRVMSFKHKGSGMVTHACHSSTGETDEKTTNLKPMNLKHNEFKDRWREGTLFKNKEK